MQDPDIVAGKDREVDFEGKNPNEKTSYNKVTSNRDLFR